MSHPSHRPGSRPVFGTFHRQEYEGNWATDECEHDSASGVDDTPFGPEKVMRCDACGWTFRTILDPEDFGQSNLIRVPAEAPPVGRTAPLEN